MLYRQRFSEVLAKGMVGGMNVEQCSADDCGAHIKHPPVDAGGEKVVGYLALQQARGWT